MRTISARRALGASLIEVLLGSAVAAVAISASIYLLSGVTGLAASTSSDTTARRRADTVLWNIVRDLRRASLASAQRPDGSVFADGHSDSWISIQVIETWSGTAGDGPRVVYRFDSGAQQVIRDANGRSELLARGVRAFRVTRNDERLAVEIETEDGPADDRRRTAVARGDVKPRNP